MDILGFVILGVVVGYCGAALAASWLTGIALKDALFPWRDW